MPPGFCKDTPDGRPPWWPATEPWPPRDWRRARGVFMRKIGCLLGFLVLVVLVIPWLVATIVFGFHIPKGGSGDGPPPLVIAVAVAILAIVAYRIVRRLRDAGLVITSVMDAAAHVSSGAYDVRVSERGPSEVRQLATSFNEMAERLEKNDSQRRAMQADIAHELRTPLSVIQGTIEGIVDGVYTASPDQLASLLKRTEMMTKLLDDLQTLSLADGGDLPLFVEPTDLRSLIDTVVANTRQEASSRSIAITSSGPSDLEADVDPVRMEQVLENLVRNALRHNTPGTDVEIRASNLGDSIEIVVTDTGDGIAPEQLPNVFDRFTKSADSGGSGLGLAIAKRLVEAHEGSIEARSELGDGTKIVITLPI